MVVHTLHALNKRHNNRRRAMSTFAAIVKVYRRKLAFSFFRSVQQTRRLRTPQSAAACDILRLFQDDGPEQHSCSHDEIVQASNTVCSLLIVQNVRRYFFLGQRSAYTPKKCRLISQIVL